ncbi:hypothetical protein [Methylomagnum ishizawai]|nr:hypothetical protein [Methylomagnum ishizawai]
MRHGHRHLTDADFPLLFRAIIHPNRLRRYAMHHDIAIRPSPAARRAR